MKSLLSVEMNLKIETLILTKQARVLVCNNEVKFWQNSITTLL